MVVHSVSFTLCLLSSSLKFFVLVVLTDTNYSPVVQSLPSLSEMT